MQKPDQNWQGLVPRLERLENQRRPGKLLALLSVVLGMAAGFIGGALTGKIAPAQGQTPAPKEISAQQFNLVDKNGTTRASLAFDNQGHPNLFLFGPQ